MASEEKPSQETPDQVIEEFSNRHDIPATYEPPSPLTGCYLLIILGEPHSHEHKDIILQRLLKGLLSWNVLECHVDLEEELNSLTNHAPEGEATRHGERLIQFASENLVTEILIHPQYNTLIQCMRNLLSSFTRHRHIIHSGYTFSGNGSWILQDATFSVSDFVEAIQDYEVQRVMRAYPDTISMEIHCAASGHWNKLPDKSYAKLCKIRINSVDILDSGSERLNAFINYLSPLIMPANLHDLMESSDVVGNIRFSHPTLYVFPGGQGDAALFGINGFNMLVDGGFNRKSCFWDFTRHLDRLDAVLMTRINNANIQGISSIIERKAMSNVYPQIGYFFTNIPESKPEPNLESDKDSDPLLVNLFERGQSITSNLKSINIKPQPCYKDIEPINLYHKVGHGTLDMFVISPSKESKEVKEFLHKWNARDQNLFATKQSKEFQFPLQNLVSICAMLVWQPANPEETITRILFPGSTPDYKIMEGLDKMKHLEFVKHPVCTANQIEASFSSTILSKKQLKSALADKSTHEPILPSKVTKTIVAQQEKDNKMVTETKQVIKTTEKETSAVNGNVETKADIEKDVKVSKPIEKEGEKDNKIASETKPIVKSRIDSRPPKSIEKKLKKDSSTEKRSSPITTPKKEPKQLKEKELKPKAIGRVAKMSPGSTPAKSTKEANNRKVFESRQKTTVKTLKKDVAQTTEKKEVKVERKAISRRPKPAAGSPMKTVKKVTKDTAVRRPKTEKGTTSDSSVVSTPSADDAKSKKTTEQEKQILLDDLIEEQEAVREIEAVLQRSEKRTKDIDDEHRAIIDKQDSTTEVDEDEEYIIIEKEEPYTEDSVNEQESADLTGKEEVKHQRDSQESEKKRKPSMETTEEEEPQQAIEKSTEQEKETVESAPDAEEVTDVKEEEKEETVPTAHKMNGTVPKGKADVEEVKSHEGSPISDEKEPSDEKKSDDKEELGADKGGDTKEGDIVNVPESQATAESGATTAPTLPEDEHITMDEIKEDVVIEEKYTKEETKETQVVVTATTDEPVERVQPKPMQFDAQQPHLRELNIKTPDEVADLPVHEEADIADETMTGSRKASLRKADEPIKHEQPIKTKIESKEIEEKEKDDTKEIEEQPEKVEKISTKEEKIESKAVAIEKKSPSPTSVDSKVTSPVEKVEYKVEDLGKQFESTLKDVTGKVDLTEESSELKGKSPTDEGKPDDIEPAKEKVSAKDETVETKSVSPDIKQEEIKTEIINEKVEEVKSDSPEKLELDRKDSVSVDPIAEKVASKSPSPDLKEETKEIPIEIKRESLIADAEIKTEIAKIIEQKPEEKSKSPSPTKDEKIDSEIKVSVSAEDVKEKEAIKVETDVASFKVGDEVKIASPTKIEEKLSASPIQDTTHTKDEKVASKSPSPDLKEQTSVSPVPDKVSESLDSKRASLIDETEIKADTVKPSAPEVEKEVEKSGSSSPIKDEKISESRKQSVAEKVSIEGIEHESASPSPPPTKEEVASPIRKESVSSVAEEPIKSATPSDLDLKSTQYKEVYDYSHPFDAQCTQELRETHITTVESPIIEKSKIIDLQVIDKTIAEIAEVESLNDIKEEDEEDRISPPQSSPKPSVPLEIQVEPPRSVSPREQEVLKIVANVAEVLKSERDITDIIPDFNEDELEKHIMQRASTPEVFSSSLQDARFAVEIDNDRKEYDLSASLSETKTSTTSIDEKEQHEIAEKHQTGFQKDTDDEDIHRKESFMSEALDDSRRESAISTFSEKDFTKDESTLDKFSRSNSSLDLKHDELDVKSTEIETHSEVTQVEKVTDSRKESIVSDRPASKSPQNDDDKKDDEKNVEIEKSLSERKESLTLKIDDDNATVQRMLVTASSEDGGEEIEICAEGTIKFSPSATTPEVISGMATPDVGHDELEKKSEAVKETIESTLEVDDLVRRESTSRQSDRPDSVMSHFSDTTEPELKETCSSPEKQVQEKLSSSSGKSTGSPSAPSSSHGSVEIEGIKSPTDQKDDSVVAKVDLDKKVEEKAEKEEKDTVKAESRAESTASDVKADAEKSSTPAVESALNTESPEKSEQKSPTPSAKDEPVPTDKSRSQSIVSEKVDISGKATPANVSRPESATSDKKDVSQTTKLPSPPPQSDEKDSLDKTDDVSAKDEPKSPVPSEKEELAITAKDESRSQSVASAISEDKVEITETQKSRTQSIVSEKVDISGKATPAALSRPESAASDKKDDEPIAKSPSPSVESAKKDSFEKEEPTATKVESRSQSITSVASVDKADDKKSVTSVSPSPSEIVKKDSLEKADDVKFAPSAPSRPESAASDISLKDGQKSPAPPSKEEPQATKVESRSQSVASAISEDKVEITETQKSRTQSIVSEKVDISGKATPADVSRPESAASDKKDNEPISKSPSPSAESDKKDLYEKDGQKSPVQSTKPEEITTKSESRSQSVASIVSEGKDDKKSVTSVSPSPSESVKKDSLEKADDVKFAPIAPSRPESAASDISLKDEQKSPAPPSKEESTVNKVESRSQSIVSVVSEEKVEIDDAQKSRSQSILSEKSDASGKATPADLSRPESIASDKLSKSSAPSIESHDDKKDDAKSPTPSIQSEKKDSVTKDDDQKSTTDSRPVSSASQTSAKDEQLPKSPAQSEKKDSVTKDDDKKSITDSRPVSSVSQTSTKDEQLSKSPDPSIISEKKDSLTKDDDKKSTTDSRPVSSASQASAKDEQLSKSPTPSIQSENKDSLTKDDDKKSTTESRPASSVSQASAKDEQLSKSPAPSVESHDDKKDDEKSPTPSVEKCGIKSETSAFIEAEKTIILKEETLIKTVTETHTKISDERMDSTASSSKTTEKSTDKKDGSDSDTIGLQITTGSTICDIHDSSDKKNIVQGTVDDEFIVHELPKKTDVLRESRSKSVASISVFGIGKAPQSLDLDKIIEVSKDDSNLSGSSRKTSDISTLIEDVKRIDEKITSKPNEKLESSAEIDEQLSSLDHKLTQKISTHSSLESTTSDKGSIETVFDGGALSTKEHSFDLSATTKEVTSSAQVMNKEISTIKIESKACRDSDNESLPISDDEAITSSQKYSYEDYQFERSNSELSKKSDLDIDDSQNDIPPQYGSQEYKSAVTVSSSYAIDPMSASFYGELPSGSEKSEPTTVTTVRTVITKQYDIHGDSEPVTHTQTTQKTFTSKSSDHKFLDEADLDFEKALEEHRQVRGADVMSSVTSKYEFSPSKFPATGQLTESTADFPLTDVKSPKDQPKDTEVITVTTATATTTITATTTVSAAQAASSAADALARQLEDDLKKAEERVASWGKPLGLPVSMNDNPPTPKRERKIVSAKIKINNEKNKRANSPNKSKKITPIYMDLTYVPHNGNSYYSHVEFFKRVRARYYVFSGTEPSRDAYNALLEAKQTWEDKNLEVTIIPTYDTDVLGYWVAENEELLAKCHIDLSPSASRCTINLQDHETSCSAYRLEF